MANVKMYYLDVNGVNNTALMAGRQSSFYLRHSQISDCGVGVFGGTRSQFYLRDSNVDACQIGAVSLQGESSTGVNIVRFLHCRIADDVEGDAAKVNKLRELTGAGIQL